MKAGHGITIIADGDNIKVRTWCGLAMSSRPPISPFGTVTCRTCLATDEYKQWLKTWFGVKIEPRKVDTTDLMLIYEGEDGITYKAIVGDAMAFHMDTDLMPLASAEFLVVMDNRVANMMTRELQNRNITMYVPSKDAVREARLLSVQPEAGRDPATTPRLAYIWKFRLFGPADLPAVEVPVKWRMDE